MDTLSESKPITSQKSRKSRDNPLYSQLVINKKVSVPMNKVGSNLKTTILQLIESKISGKCISEGFIKPNSIKILSFSNGIQESNNIKFEVVLECLVCSPVEGQVINCIAKNITKAGIRAEVNDDYNPLVIFVARDHNYLNKNFSNIKESQDITVRVIGQRFELNDKNISVIAELLDIKSKSPKLKIESSSKTPISLDVDKLDTINTEN
jgi:DNA-directed RNA polymerase subunit E'/Rpb7